MDLSDDERAFVNVARNRIRKHSRHRRDEGHFDKLHAVVRSTRGAIYAAMTFETSMPQFDFCAE